MLRCFCEHMQQAALQTACTGYPHDHPRTCRERISSQAGTASPSAPAAGTPIMFRGCRMAADKSQPCAARTPRSVQGHARQQRRLARRGGPRAQSLLKAMMSMDWMFSDSPSRTSSSSMIASMDSTLESSMMAVICIFLMP